MPPPGGGKRKRGDRSYSGDNYSRPSPHRPENLTLAQHNSGRDYYDNRRGRGKSNRGGRGGSTNSSPINTNFDSIPSKKTLSEPVTDNGPIVVEPNEPIPLQPYQYTHITDDICNLWNVEGRQNILDRGLEFLQSGDGLSITIIIQELLQSTLDERVIPNEAGKIIKELIENNEMVQSTVLDTISIIFENKSNLNYNRLFEFINATNIPSDILRHELDAVLLEKLELIRNTFNRMGIRKQTNLLYRQANFNLMREESEGFAKLMTELFTTSGNEPPSGEVVNDTVEKVKAMIGAFDLDVGRTLDVVLDVFGAVLVKQFRFFVKFLRSSPWWPRNNHQQSNLGGLPQWALPGFSGWRLTESQYQDFLKATQERDRKFWNLAKHQGLKAFFFLGQTPINSTDSDQWIQSNGNRDAAQLLGFKLRFYSSSPARDENDVLPDNLIYLSALLIKIGFISLKDLYPHIWRSDESMEILKQQKTKEKIERENLLKSGIGTKNALLTAGALSDDTLPVPSRLKESSTRAGTPTKESEIEKSKDNEPLDQKVTLLKSLLAIGALPEALFILGKFPWIIDLYTDLPEYIHRICHHSLNKVYQSLRPLQSRSSLQTQKPSYDIGIPKGQIKLVDISEKKVLRWALLDKTDSSDGTDYRFYWDEWNDNIPICQNIDDVFTLSQTLLKLVGVKIGHDPSLVLKIVRIGKYSLLTDKSETNYARWLDLSKRILLPSLSLTKSNAGVVSEVFELINNFPTNIRYLMYLEWSTGRTSRNSDIKSASDQAISETKDILKRISKTNTKQMARALAKIAYANPHIVITTALKQIEVYDSIADVFVEGTRYFTDLGYDVLTWAIINSMAQVGRSRTQIGGIFTSHWLSALAQFAGKIYRRYSMMKPGPLLQYVAEQLNQRNSTDLKMLEQIIVSMGGISTDTSFNDSQLQAMGGGPLLQSQTILQLLDKRHDSKLTSKRLIKSLQDTGLTGKFLLLMAQQRQACVFEDPNIPLKAIGNTYDEIHRIMIQYLDLLKSNLTTEEFQKSIPNVVELLIDYEIKPEIAFWICRPLISKQISDNNKDQIIDIEMSDQSSDGETDDLIISTSIDTDNIIPNSDFDTIEKKSNWNPIMKEIMDSIEDHTSPDIIDIVGLGFYVTFWQLSLYDITIPGKSYEDELSRQHKKIATISADRSDISISGTRKKETEKKLISELIDNLLAENKHHLKSFAESKTRLTKEKDQWFLGKARINEQLNIALMEHCFLPRILSSPLDAYFCFKFVKFLHSTGTPNFRTLGFYDLFFRSSRLSSLIFICTSKEADNFGRFLNEVLKDLSRWHLSKNTFEKEGWGLKKNLPGFAMKVEGGKVISLLDFESFRRVLYKWHGHLYSSLIKCLTSSEYMHIRNAISVLRSISTIYPVVNWHGTGLQKSVDKLRDSDKEDLKVSSQALLGALYRKEKSWIIPQAFRQGQDDNPEKLNKMDDISVNEKKAESKTGLKSEISKADTPKPETSKLEILKAETPKPESIKVESSKTESIKLESIKPEESKNVERTESKPLPIPRRISPSRPINLPNRPEVDRSQRHSRTINDRSIDRSRDVRQNYRGQYEEYDRNRREISYSKDEHGHDKNYGSRPSERERLPPRSQIRENRERPTTMESKPISKPIQSESVPINPERAALINESESASPRRNDEKRDKLSNQFGRDDHRHQSNQLGRDDNRHQSNQFERRDQSSNQFGRSEKRSHLSNQSGRPQSNQFDKYENRQDQTGNDPKRLNHPGRDQYEKVERRFDQPNQYEKDSRRQPIQDSKRYDQSIPEFGNESKRHDQSINEKRPDQVMNEIEKDSKSDVPLGPKRPLPRTRPTQERPTPTGPSRHTRQNSSDTSIHPSRINQIEPIDTKPTTPTGPKNTAPVNAPLGPSPTTRGPPNNDSTRGRNRHPLTAVNNTLVQAGQGTSIRGRGGRQNNGQFPHTSPPTRENFQPDLFAQNSNDTERSSRRDEQRGYRSTPRDDPRKHGRPDESTYGRGGSRMVDKRPRRGN